MTSFSRSEIRRLFFSGPAITRAIASSSSSMPMTLRLARAARIAASLAADRVDLVHEDDARAVLPGLVEEVAHAAGADADEHLDELGAGDAEERHPGLARHRLGQQRLAGAGRADHQHPLRDARPQ